MRRFLVCTAIAILAFFLLGCGSSGEVTDPAEEAPDWMVEKDRSDNYVFGSGTATAGTYGVAIEKAEVRARQDIAESMQMRLRSMTEDFREEVEDAELEQFTQTTRTVVNQTLAGTQVAESKIVESGGEFRSYILIEMPIGEAAKSFLNRIQTKEEAYTRFRKSEAFNRMQEAIENYENE